MRVFISTWVQAVTVLLRLGVEQEQVNLQTANSLTNSNMTVGEGSLAATNSTSHPILFTEVGAGDDDADQLAAAEEEYPLQLLEIHDVAIHQDKEDSATPSAFSGEQGETTQYYVAFSTRDRGGGRRKKNLLSDQGVTTRSFSLASNGEPASVNAHIDPTSLVGKDVYCEVYRRKKFFLPYERVGSVTFSLDELLLKRPTTLEERYPVVKAIVNRKTGRETKAQLTLQLIPLRWKEIYGAVPTEAIEGFDQHVDKFFSFNIAAFDKMIAETHNPTADQLEPPTQKANPNLEVDVYLDGLLKFAKKGEFESVPAHIGIGMNLLNKLPDPDRQTPYKSRAGAIRHVRKVVIKECIPEPPEGRWEDPTRDASMKRVFFSSIGTPYVRKMRPEEQVGRHAGCSVYEADTTHLALLKYRGQRNGKYEPMGCRTYFDEQGEILSIEELHGTVYKPGDEHWEWAKLKSRSSVFTDSAFEHLVQYHYIWGNIPSMALRMFLPPDHPIRRTFTCHYWKTAFTCSQAQWALFDDKGILARTLSMHYYGGLESIFIKLLRRFKFSHFPDDLEVQGVRQCEFHVGATDGMDLHQIFTQYASDILDEVYEGKQAKLDADEAMRACWNFLVKKLRISNSELTLDTLKKVWGELLFRATGGHAAVGAVAAFVLDPSFCDVRLMPKEKGPIALMGNQEGTTGVGLIGAMTTLPAPTLGQDWSQVLENPENPAYLKLRDSLKKLGRVIDVRNRSRFTCVDYHPEIVTLSMSA